MAKPKILEIQENTNIKTFTSPSQIGVEAVDGVVSIAEICEKLPEGSHFIYSSTGSVAFQEFNEVGATTVEIIKHISFRCVVTIYSSTSISGIGQPPGIWVANWRTDVGLSNFYNINSVTSYDLAKLTFATGYSLVTAVGRTLKKQGKEVTLNCVIKADANIPIGATHIFTLPERF